MRAGVAGAGASLVAAAVWVMLSAWRPTVTLHLAPVLVAGVGPYVAWSRHVSRGGLVVSALRAVAVLAAASLSSAGWLAGPTWFGADATHEALILTASVTVALVGIAAARGVSVRDRG